MSDETKAWDGMRVRTWLARRSAAAALDQAAADRRGYAAQDDYDKAAAEAWVCRTLGTAPCTDDQHAFAARLKQLLGAEEYPVTGVYDDSRFERHVRAHLRKLARMTKTNAGFENVLRYQ